MHQGLDSMHSRRELADELRFQQSLLKLASVGKSVAPRKQPHRNSEAQARQLAAWAEQLVPTGTGR